MRKRRIIGYIVVAIFFSFCTVNITAQTVETLVDKNHILIGEQIKLSVKVTISNNFYISKWITIPDSIAHFEVIEKSSVDTVVFKNNLKTIQQNIILTSFDSGRWGIPCFTIHLAKRNNQPVQKLLTDSFAIDVGFSPPDSTHALRDIKPIMQVSVIDYFWYYIIAGVVSLVLLAFLIWRYFRKRKKNLIYSKTKLSAYEEAMKELQKLLQYDLQNPQTIKLYYIKLIDIFKQYLSRKENKNLLNKTTGELLIHLGESNLSQQNISGIAATLRCSDAAKFAKYIPSITESKESTTSIKEIINVIEQQKPLNS